MSSADLAQRVEKVKKWYLNVSFQHNLYESSFPYMHADL